MRALQTIFTVLLIIQSIANVVHDWIDIPGIIHGRQVRAAIGMRKMIAGTVLNIIIPAPAVYFAIRDWQSHPSLGAKIYWLLYSAFVAMGAISAWWVLYFKGTDEKTTKLYSQMCAGTIQVLPPRGDHPRPNLFHLFLHAIFGATLIFSIATCFVD